MDESLIETVRDRAGHACEYCRLPEDLHPGPFEVEHIVPKQHGGPTVPGNLAYSCMHCNRHKWERHFRWEGPLVVGRTPIGRVTVQVLAINDPVRVALRQELIDEGLFPPA